MVGRVRVLVELGFEPGHGVGGFVSFFALAALGELAVGLVIGPFGGGPRSAGAGP